jgi:hypothetical protein
MPINGLANNQMVSEAAAAASGNLTLKSGQSGTNSNKCMTKTEALTRYQVDSGAMSAYVSNQLPPSEVWIPISCSFTADFIDQSNQPAPTCPGRVVAFQICNSNASKDDNFDIYLNDIYIGKVDLSTDAFVGSVFIGNTDPAVVITSSDFVCPLTGMVTYRFTPTILKAYNLVEMRNTLNNGNNNQGSLGFRNYSLSGNNLSSPVVLADLTYLGASGLNFIFNFEWLTCI